MKPTYCISSLLLLILFYCAPAWSKTFKTQFIRLELPPNWDCKQEEIDWVCQPDNITERSEVILVIVSKPVDDSEDTLEKYETILKTPKKMRDLLGNTYTSQIKYTVKKSIRQKDWVDSLQYGSEIPGFFTRYVASTKEKIAGLITYSIAETAYPKWSELMDNMVNSAELFFDPKAFAEAMKSGSGSLLGARGAHNKRLAPSLEEVQNEEEKKKSGSTAESLVALGVAAAAIGYIIWKRKQKQS